MQDGSNGSDRLLLTSLWGCFCHLDRELPLNRPEFCQCSNRTTLDGYFVQYGTVRGSRQQPMRDLHSHLGLYAMPPSHWLRVSNYALDLLL